MIQPSGAFRRAAPDAAQIKTNGAGADNPRAGIC